MHIVNTHANSCVEAISFPVTGFVFVSTNKANTRAGSACNVQLLDEMLDRLAKAQLSNLLQLPLEKSIM